MARFQAAEPTGTGTQQVELLVRAALSGPANALVGYLLQHAADRSDTAYPPPPGWHCKGRETRQVQGLFGTFPLTRDYYYHPGKGEGHYPADAALGLEGRCTPALARLICFEGATAGSYEEAEKHLRQTGGLAVDARQVQRVLQPVGEAAQAWQGREALDSLPGTTATPVFYISADATGVPMRRAELHGRKGRQPDGSAKTRMAYLGCVFTQHHRDTEGHPIRDHASTTYVASFDTSDAFGPRLRQEAIRRGLGQAGRVVLLVDGASGLERLGRLCFPTALQIVDYYHALEHAGEVLVALPGSKEHPDYQRRRRQWARRLLRNGVKALLAETRQEAAGRACAAAVEQALGYFADNLARMQYGQFRKAGLFIGSGVVEAGCKSVIGARCKQAGMFWGRDGAEHVLALRCVEAGGQLDAFWQARLNAHAARNDTLTLAA